MNNIGFKITYRTKHLKLMSTRFQLLILLDDVTYRVTKINDEQLGHFLNHRTVSISREMQFF